MLDGYDRAAERRLDAAETEREQDWVDQLELEQRATDARRAALSPALRTELASLQATGRALLAFMAATEPRSIATAAPARPASPAPAGDGAIATDGVRRIVCTAFPTFRDIEDPYTVAYLTPGRVR